MPTSNANGRKRSRLLPLIPIRRRWRQTTCRNRNLHLPVRGTTVAGISRQYSGKGKKVCLCFYVSVQRSWPRSRQLGKGSSCGSRKELICSKYIKKAMYSNFPAIHDAACRDRWSKSFVKSHVCPSPARSHQISNRSPKLCYNSMHPVRTEKPQTGQARAEGRSNMSISQL